MRFLRSKWTFRLAAVLLGLAPFFILELIFITLDVGRAESMNDPFVGFHSIQPLFVLNETGDRYEIPPSRQTFFRPDGFAAIKPADEFRIFCLGGSTVQGRPYAIETSFTTWLELALQSADNRRRWQVVNCGGVSYASYRLVPILQEVLQYEPDLIIVYMGHNEFLEDRTYDHIKRQPAWSRRLQQFALKTRTYRVLRSSLSEWNEPNEARRKQLPAEVEARLDYRGGLEQYHRDNQWRETVVEHFRFNLERMVQIARDADVPLILMNPVSNLRDCPPFKSEHRADLDETALRRWNALWDEAKTHYATNIRASLECFQAAAEIDAEHASLQYQLGVCFDSLGDLDAARHHYTLAKELDICPLRMLEVQHAALLEIAEQTRTPLVDVREEISSRCRGNIPDDSWLVDHVHPSIRGHQLVAGLLLDEMQRAGLVTADDDWQRRRDEAFEQHLASLPELYFHEAARRLDGLRRWAHGRATLERQPNHNETDDQNSAKSDSAP